MNNRHRISTIILIIIGLSIIILAQDKGQTPVQEEIPPIEEDTVKIAVTYEKLAENVQLWPHPVTGEKVTALVNFTEAEINQYCMDNQIDFNFQFIPTPVIRKGGTQAGENPPGLDETIELDEAGINLIVGHDYSLANRYSLDYANEHDMLLLSPQGVGVRLSIPDDNLFKLSPDEYEDPDVYDRVFAQMIKELGYLAFISINTGTHCINRNLLDETAQAISYDYEETQVEFDINAEDFTPYLDRAAENLQAAIDTYGVDRVCVLMERLWDERVSFLDLMDDRPVFETVTWFDFDGMSEERIIELGLEPRYAKYGFISIRKAPAVSDKATAFLNSYMENVGELPTPSRRFGEAARYDAMWIMAKAVIEANSTSTEDVKKAIPQVCREYLGVIGNCTLNSLGDRISADYDVYRWRANQFENIGHYDADNQRFNIEARPVVEWNRTFGGLLEDVGLYVQQTPDEGYIIAGLTISFGEGEHDILILKTDSQGNHVWNKTIGGPEYDTAYAIQPCTDGGYVITGSTETSGPMNNEAFLLKIDSEGNTIWMKTYGNNTSSRFVQETSDKGFILVGSSLSDFLLIRTDQNGTLLWNRTYDGRGRDLGRCVQQTRDGGFIVTGIIDSWGPEKGLSLIKVDGDGGMVWNTSLSDYGDAGDFIQETEDGFIVTGYTRKEDQIDCVLVKTDSEGIVQWSRGIGGLGRDSGSCVQRTKDGDYVVVGTSSSFGDGSNDVFLFEVDAGGSLLWNITVGGLENDGGSCVQQTRDGGFIVSGYTQSYGKGDSDVFLIKYSEPRLSP